MSLRFNALRSVARIPLRSRNDPRSPEKSLLAAQAYFFDDSSVHATFNPELGLHPLRLPRSGCRKNLNSRSELLFRIPWYLNFAQGQRPSPKVSQPVCGKILIHVQNPFSRFLRDLSNRLLRCHLLEDFQHLLKIFLHGVLFRQLPCYPGTYLPYLVIEEVMDPIRKG